MQIIFFEIIWPKSAVEVSGSSSVHLPASALFVTWWQTPHLTTGVLGAVAGPLNVLPVKSVRALKLLSCALLYVLQPFLCCIENSVYQNRNKPGRRGMAGTLAWGFPSCPLWPPTLVKHQDEGGLLCDSQGEGGLAEVRPWEDFSQQKCPGEKGEMA